jgi:DUF1009 family protein
LRKLGLIAGGGGLPITLANHCVQAGRPLFVVRLRGFADPALQAFEGAEIGIAEFGRTFEALKRAGCQAVCLAGMVKRPDFSALKPDLRGLRSLPGAIAAATRGDDQLLRFILREFEAEGFAIEGADQVSAEVTVGSGPLGALEAPPSLAEDIALAVRVAEAMGALDIGQAAVVVRGVVLAVEAQEGTDAMLARCLDLPAAVRGAAHDRAGVLVKWPKPIQDLRIDLPVIGLQTVEAAAATGLAGIVVQAGRALLVDRAAVIAEADRLGLFVVGLKDRQV